MAIESNKRIEITDAVKCEIVAATVTLAMVHTITCGVYHSGRKNRF